MAIARDDRFVTDAQGRALSGALVYYCTQPASTSTLPPSPLATVFSSTSGTAGTNPVVTDGFGHSVAYLGNTILYTVVISHPLFGANPVVLPDQAIGGLGGGGGSGLTPFSVTPTGTIDGSNRVFTLPVVPVEVTVWLNFPLIPGLGYALSGATITYATAPQTGDSIYAQGFF